MAELIQKALLQARHPRQCGRNGWRNFKLNKIWQKHSTSCLLSCVCGVCTWSKVEWWLVSSLGEKYNEISNVLQIFLGDVIDTFFPRLPFWNTQYITSVPFIHGCSVAADMCCVTLRDGRKSHLKNRMAGHRKCIISAPLPLWNTKHKCKSRCEKKQQVFSSRLSLWFPPAEVPLSFTKMELFKGSTAPHVSFREMLRGRLLRLVSKESNLRLSEHPKNTVHPRQKTPRWWMKESGSHICHLPAAHRVKEHLFYLESHLLLVLQNVTRAPGTLTWGLSLFTAAVGRSSVTPEISKMIYRKPVK